MTSSPSNFVALVRVLVVACATLVAGGAACLGDGEGEPDAGANLNRPVIDNNCGETASVGNALGIGQYCEATSDCPVAGSGTTIQCSTVLTSDALPLLCSRICGELDGGSIDCGEGAACHNIIELGYDLEVCVPFTCDPLFDGGVPRPDDT